LSLAKEGNRYVGEESKDKVVQIRSEKSIGGTVPSIWYVVYYDPNTTFKAIEVKFGAGKKLDIKRPLRLLEPVRHGQEPLDLSRIKIDSDQALKIALSEQLVEKLKVNASSAKLERSDGLPVWKIRLWAAKLRNPNDQADLGELVLSAEDGKVLKNDLHINRVD